MPDIINYSGVTLSRKEFTVLKDVSFNVEAGQLCYLIGRVGSGKSTLLKSIYADIPISEGQATVLDYDLTEIRRKDIPYLRRCIGFVFQDYQLLSDRNAYANLDFVLGATGWKSKVEKEERIEEVLNAVGMSKKAYKMPHELSGGEQQRIAIARALLNNPSLILADEPTGNLDPLTGDHIMDRIDKIAKNGTAVVVATHNLALIERFPGRILECKDKQLIVH